MDERERSTLFLLAALVSLLAIKFNPKEVSPFETHPLIMAFLVLDLIVYVMALKKENELQSDVHKILIHRICHMTSTLAIVLLVILLFRDLGWFLLAFWIVLEAWETYKSYKQIKLPYGHAVEEEPSQPPVDPNQLPVDPNQAPVDQNQSPVGRQFLWQPLILVTDCFS